MSDNYNIPFPYVKTDNDGKIIYKNNAFEKLSEEAASCTDFYAVAPDFDITKYFQRIKYSDKYYDLYSIPCNDGFCITMAFNDNINQSGMIKSNVMVGLLVIDNYTEVEEGMEEARLSHIFAIIERKINDYFNNLGGIVRKFEKDRFLIVLNREQLAHLKEDKFSIVDQIEKIDLGNIPVTVSLGIGHKGVTLNEDMEFARGALDLALGRGGNQIVIKESDEKYEYIGGDGNEVIKNSRVKARVKAYGFKELILSAKDVMIMGHKNPDLDSLGSAAGAFSVVNFYGKKCHIVLNNVTNAVKPLYERLIRDKRYDGVFINGEQAIENIRRTTLVVVVDTHRTMLTECPELLEKTKRIVVFDHHRKCADAIENYSLTYHEAYASSAAEMITEMIMYTKGLKISKDEAEGLLAGITVDTKNFAFKTGIKTFEAAAYLKRLGADSVSVRRLFKNSFDEYLARTEVVRTAEIIHDNMAISYLQKEVENPSVMIAMAADELLSIKGVEVSFVLCKVDDIVYISSRSLGNMNVQKLMEKMGGGGHQLGAAAQLKNMSLESARALLEKYIEEYIEENKK